MNKTVNSFNFFSLLYKCFNSCFSRGCFLPPLLYFELPMFLMQTLLAMLMADVHTEMLYSFHQTVPSLE